MKTKKNTKIAKINLLMLMALQISPTYSMMPRLRLGLQQSIQIAGLARKPITTIAAPRIFSTNNSFNNSQHSHFYNFKIPVSTTLLSLCAVAGGCIAADTKIREDESFLYKSILAIEEMTEKVTGKLVEISNNPNSLPITASLDSTFFAQATNDSFSEAQCVREINIFLHQPDSLSKEELVALFMKHHRAIISNIGITDTLRTIPPQFPESEIEKNVWKLLVKEYPDRILTYLSKLLDARASRIQYGLHRDTYDSYVVNCYIAPLANTFLDHGNPNVFVPIFLRHLYSLPHEQQRQLLKENHALILESLEDISPDWSTECKTLLKQYAFEGNKVKILMLFFKEHLDFLSQEEQEKIIASYSSCLLQNLEGLSNRRQLWPVHTQQLFIKMLLEKGTTDQLVYFFLRKPHFFSMEQSNHIINAHKDRLLGILKEKSSEVGRTIPEAQSEAHVTRFASNWPTKFAHSMMQLLIESVSKKESSSFCHNESLQTLIAYLEKMPELFSLNQKKQVIDSILDLYAQKTDMGLILIKHHTIFPAEQYDRLAVLHKEEIVDILKRDGWNSNWIGSCRSSSLIKELHREIIGNSYDNNGPLFSNYLEKNKDNLSKLFWNEGKQPHVYNLLPSIAEYAQKQYAQNKIVLFHGQKSVWVLLEMIYSKLVRLKNNKNTDSEFKHLRFIEHSTVAEEEIQNVRKYGANYYLGLKEDSVDQILFTNLHPAANDSGSNSWDYISYNVDLAGDEEFIYLIMVEKIFNDLAMTDQYKALQKFDPTFFNDIYSNFKKCVKEQGNHGNLVAISMPENIAVKLAYSTNGSGVPKALKLAKWWALFGTTNIVTLAQNYDHVPFKNAYALILSEEIINQESAEKAGVAIRYFNTFEDTEDYLKIIKTFEEKIASTKGYKTTPLVMTNFLKNFKEDLG